MTQSICQWIFVILQVGVYFVGVRTAIDGGKGSNPEGFTGFVELTLAQAVVVALLYGAGMYDSLEVVFQGWQP